jgi:hypothetical protein
LHLTGGRLAVVAVIVAAAIAVPIVLAATGSPLPVFKAGPFTGRDPVSIAFPGTTDGGVETANTVDDLKWSWSSGQAVGQGTANSICEPNCTGIKISMRATIVLSRPHDGVFTGLSEKTGGRVTTYSYPDNWPVDAT